MPNLEIGPGKKRQPGFQTVDVDPKADVDLITNPGDPLPFHDNHFDIVFASHILEHIVWYDTRVTLDDWIRVLKPGGTIEIWVPNAYKIMKALIDTEETGSESGMRADGWYRSNPGKSPYIWANGRIFTYGDGKGTLDHPNWHRTIFTPKYLRALLREAGLRDVRMLDPKTERRGHGHGWIDMGATGVKP